MLDINYIKDNADLIQNNIKERYMHADVSLVIDLHKRVNETQGELEVHYREINKKSQLFPSTTNDKDKEKLKQEIFEHKQNAKDIKSKVASLRESFMEEMYKIPNVCASDVPDGKTDEDNIPISKHLEPTRFKFTPKTHLDLVEDLDLVDFKAGTKVTGSKFYFLKNEAVILELSLIRFALDIAMKHGFAPMLTPDLAKNSILRGSGYEPRGKESQIYRIEGEEISLIGTSEITIGGYFSDEVIDKNELPIKICGVSQCFRTEAGSYGKESKGLYRVHQFNKAEIYSFCTPDESETTLKEILAIEEEIYKKLEIPYQVVSICKGDLGAPAYKKYDIEAWMLSRGENGGYGEVTSVSNCTDFQARRLNIKFRDSKIKKNKFVHTLNGTAIATTRTMLALLENNQDKDGNILIPSALQPYTGFSKIEKKNL